MTKLDEIWTPSVHQAVYRRLLNALSYPGEVVDMGERAALSVLATLCDDATTLADPSGLLDRTIRDFLRCPDAPPERADFVLMSATQPPAPGFTPRLGELENPELGATLLLVGESVRRGQLKLLLKGPGVATQTELSVGGFHPAWFQRRAEWVENFPLGVDLILCDAKCVAALPRTTALRLEV
jgi:alpha-D-ribose 1-methylphosphonate 5-triphosphate synthase subunit PhnH